MQAKPASRRAQRGIALCEFDGGARLRPDATACPRTRTKQTRLSQTRPSKPFASGGVASSVSVS